MGRKLGYARVSTTEQILDLQIDALKAAGCDHIYSEKLSSMARSRPQLKALLADLAPGDSLVIWRLDRLGRDLSQLIATVEEFKEREITLVSLTEGFDTRTPAGKMLFHIIGAMAEMERNITVQRVTAGMSAAKKRGRILGRPPKLNTEKLEIARQMRDSGKSWVQIGLATGLHHSTIFRGWKREAESNSTNAAL